ncbi:hypothetical protein D3C77_478490 [compost metagenome]
MAGEAQRFGQMGKAFFRLPGAVQRHGQQQAQFKLAAILLTVVGLNDGILQLRGGIHTAALGNLQAQASDGWKIDIAAVKDQPRPLPATDQVGRAQRLGGHVQAVLQGGDAGALQPAGTHYAVGAGLTADLFQFGKVAQPGVAFAFQIGDSRQ